MPCSLHTNCEIRKAQKPEESADKICTWPVSRMRIPTHTSASHILLYSDAFFSIFALRRYCFWCINFLVDEFLDRVVFKAAIVSWYEAWSISGPRPHESVRISIYYNSWCPLLQCAYMTYDDIWFYMRWQSRIDHPILALGLDFCVMPWITWKPWFNYEASGPILWTVLY